MRYYQNTYCVCSKHFVDINPLIRQLYEVAVVLSLSSPYFADEEHETEQVVCGGAKRQIQTVLSQCILLPTFNRQVIWQLTKQEVQISNEILEQLPSPATK